MAIGNCFLSSLRQCGIALFLIAAGHIIYY
jgi:hypothetical protein